jgi:hypothetical protein
MLSLSTSYVNTVWLNQERALQNNDPLRFSSFDPKLPNQHGGATCSSHASQYLKR